MVKDEFELLECGRASLVLGHMLTFANADDVILFGQQQRQALHQQQGFMVAQRRRLPVVEHLVQRRGLHLRSHQDAFKHRYNAAGSHTKRSN